MRGVVRFRETLGLRPVQLLLLAAWAILHGASLNSAEPREPFRQGLAVSGADGRGWLPQDQIVAADRCSACHVPEGRKWKSGFRPHSFLNEMVQVQYRLAWEKSYREGKGDELPASCVACHSPLQYLAGNIPSPGQRLLEDEGISCDFCHSTWGFEGDLPGQFNWLFRKGGNRFGPEIESALGKGVRFTKAPELCGTCHNERGPRGHWVKTTFIEWERSPYKQQSKKGCLDCHTQFTREFVDSLIPGSVQLALTVSPATIGSNGVLNAKILLTNIRAGHAIPTGSTELRQVWLRVEAVRSDGRTFAFRVLEKGFPNEALTMAPQNLDEYGPSWSSGGSIDAPEGSMTDSIRQGDRRFGVVFRDEAGHVTPFEWEAASIAVDYRLWPAELLEETFSLALPPELEKKNFRVRATLWYRRSSPTLLRGLGMNGIPPSILVAEADAIVKNEDS